MTRVLYERPADRDEFVDVMGPVTRAMAWGFVEAIFAEDVVVTLPSDGSRVDDFHVENREDGWYVIAKPLPREKPDLRLVR
jgi:hypothetical protein